MLYKYNCYPIILVIAIYRQWRNSLQHVSNFVSTFLLSMATGKDIDHLNVFFLITVFFHVIDKWYKLLRFFPFFSITWHTIRTNHLQKTTKIDSRTQITKRYTNTTNEHSQLDIPYQSRTCDRSGMQRNWK